MGTVHLSGCIVTGGARSGTVHKANRSTVCRAAGFSGSVASLRLQETGWLTVTDLWDTANWMEREAWDFFGIHFSGHPNLKRILNMEDFPAFPMRKDYPLEDPTREDKNDTFFGR